jgi:pyridoxine 5-phosphate synthase
VRLAVNVDHVATLRQARGGVEPDPVWAAALAELAGAEGIIVHLREDRRHIQDRDLRLLRQTVKTKLNMEMAAIDEMIGIAAEIKPDLCTLVPEKRQELTTEGGLSVARNQAAIGSAVERLQAAGIRVSLFIDPEPDQVKAAREVGAEIVEIHTGRYADAAAGDAQRAEFKRLEAAFTLGREAGLSVSAGHGLNYVNVQPVVALDLVSEFSIGHAIISRAVLVGLEPAVAEMVALVKSPRPELLEEWR